MEKRLLCPQRKAIEDVLMWMDALVSEAPIMAYMGIDKNIQNF